MMCDTCTAVTTTATAASPSNRAGPPVPTAAATGGTEKQESNLAGIVGGVLGGVAFLALFGVGIYRCARNQLDAQLPVAQQESD